MTMLWDENDRGKPIPPSGPVDQTGGSRERLETGAEAGPNGGDAPVVMRLQRVQELRTAIARGTYCVPVEEIADSLIRFADRRRRVCGSLYSA